MNILGINAYHGDASAALVVDGRLVAAVEEERFNRIKHWAGFPVQSIGYCLRAGGLEIDEVDHVVISRDPSAHLLKKVLFALATRPSLSLVRDRLSNAGRVRDVGQALAEGLGVDPARVKAQTHQLEHHRAHMASSFLVSPFDHAACLSIDGFGDFVSAMWGVGTGTAIQVLDQVTFPHSVGLFYTAVTQYLGFWKYGDEYKVMGLAPYGEPEFLPDFRTIIQPDGAGYRMDLDYFLHHSEGVPMVWDGGSPTIGRAFSDAFVKRFGPARDPQGPLEPRHANLAASLQAVAEELYFHVLNQLQARTGLRRLCLAGGVAFNSVANGKIRERTGFEDVYFQPAAGDAGTALGAAMQVWHQVSGRPRDFVMTHASWGPEFSTSAMASALDERAADLAAARVEPRQVEHSNQRCLETARALADEKVVGWFHGRMEWGPRALGQRSILADPRNAGMKDILNARIKRREPFRPFCPSVLASYTSEYFERAHPDPFMITVYDIKPEKRPLIPAVTHVDGTGRLQTVTPETCELYWQLIEAFRQITGVPVLLNTSFNENEPIVCSPAEAIDCFLRTRMDMLVLGPFVMRKSSPEQPRETT